MKPEIILQEIDDLQTQEADLCCRHAEAQDEFIVPVLERNIALVQAEQRDRIEAYYRLTREYEQN